MKLMFVAGALALAFGSQALAADLPPPMAPPPARAPAAYVPVAPPFSWSGVYIGLNGGYAFGNSMWATVPSGNFTVNGGLAGGTLGVNYQMGQFVLGLEGDLDWQGVKGSVTSGNCLVLLTASCNSASNWVSTFRGRVGFAIDRILIYGTAGGAFANVEAKLGGLPYASMGKLGWSAGGGVEVAMTDNWSAKLEYIFAGFQDASCPASNCGLNETVRFDESTIRLGVNYRFY